MYQIRKGSGRDEPIEVLTFVSDMEAVTKIIEMIKEGEVEPDGSDLPEVITLIDDISEFEVDVYYGDSLSNKAQIFLDEMWEALGKLWEKEEDEAKFWSTLNAYEARVNELSYEMKA